MLDNVTSSSSAAPDYRINAAVHPFGDGNWHGDGNGREYWPHVAHTKTGHGNSYGLPNGDGAPLHSAAVPVFMCVAFAEFYPLHAAIEEAVLFSTTGQP